MYYKFTISPLNSEKILNKLCGFEIFNIEKSNESLSFCCKLKYCKNIKKLLKNSGISIKSELNIGIFGFFRRFFSVGILCGILISFAFYLISSLFITNVLILGDISFCGQQIMQVLKNNNINKWSKKSSIDIKKLENEIQSINYVSYVSAIIKGNSLIINIREQLTNSEFVNIGGYLPIVSAYDCKITSIKVVQGSAKVHVGDIVKVGQILVEPYIDVDGEQMSVQPLADIQADVWFTNSVDFYDTIITKERTGRKISNYQMTFLGVPIYSHCSDVDFKNFEVEEKEVRLTDTLLPIKIYYTNYYEYVTVSQNIDFEKNKQQFIEQTRQTCLLNLNNYDIIKDESYVINKSQDCNTIFYTITLSRKIC